MEINCLPINDDISTGFDCAISGSMSDISSTLISIGGPTETFIENYWTNGELIISFLLFVFLMFEIFKYGFEVFFPKIVELKKWRK